MTLRRIRGKFWRECTRRMKDMRRRRTEELRVIAKSANAVPAGGVTDPGSKHSRKVEISRRGRKQNGVQLDVVRKQDYPIRPHGK